MDNINTIVNNVFRCATLPLWPAFWSARQIWHFSAMSPETLPHCTSLGSAGLPGLIALGLPMLFRQNYLTAPAANRLKG